MKRLARSHRLLTTLQLTLVRLLLLYAWVTPALSYERLQGPTELLYADPQLAQPGYTLFGARGTTYLLDLQGQVVHTWPAGTNPHLLANGNILDASRDDPSGTAGLREVDWDGKLVWEYTEKRAGYAPHHDWTRIYNPQLKALTTLYIANKTISEEQALAAGANPATGPYRDTQMDAVVEVDANGQVVWEWWFFDHVVQDIDPAKPNYVGQGKTVADYPGRININMPGKPLHRDWLHCNSIDYSPELDQIVVNSVQGELYVIDHGGTFVAGDAAASIAKAAGPAGDFLYRFGDPARYGQGEPPSIGQNWDAASSGHKQMGGTHHVSWIRAGLPGAGHLLIFNNGQYLYQRTPHSSVLEVNPYLDGNGRDTGKYVNPPLAGYRREQYDKDTHNQPRLVSNQIVWSYSPNNSHGFFSHIGSSAQRLPNGNTFICSDTEGHFFEVTSDGRLVWEYINPITPQGPVKVIGDNLPMLNSVFRAFRLAPDHAALKGRELTPRGTITGATPSPMPATVQPVSTGQVQQGQTGGPGGGQRGQGGGQRGLGGQGGGQGGQGGGQRQPQ
ncbi:MAG: aryl-sulfate sulfotransferase [Armatimonadetes bacterium]|nr:aryl-sulfate sulfotransferase [Armatimonadota bacterium]